MTLKSITAQKLFPIGIVGSLAIISLLSIWKLPQWQVQPIQQQIDALKTSKQAVDSKEIAALEKSKLDAENAARTVLVQGAGGLFAAAAAYIAWRNLKATQEKQVAERFSKAVEQLGSENIHVRLGGIYALEQIAKDAEEKYYWQVMETLTAYVREKAPTPLGALSKSSLLHKHSENWQKVWKIPGLPETDTQIVLVVLSRRKYRYGHSLESSRLNLNSVDLPGISLPDDAQLFGADLISSNLQLADLAFVDLRDSRFCHAKLQQADFGGAKLDNANFFKADLQEADFGGSSLVEARFSGANLEKVTFYEANLYKAELPGASLQEADFRKANLENTRFASANLDKALFIDANVHGTSFYQASLRNVNFTNTKGLTDKQLSEAESYEGAFCEILKISEI
mgnify:CR=1 FL=1